MFEHYLTDPRRFRRVLINQRSPILIRCIQGGGVTALSYVIFRGGCHDSLLLLLLLGCEVTLV